MGGCGFLRWGDPVGVVSPPGCACDHPHQAGIEAPDNLLRLFWGKQPLKVVL
jgi:hypothetical protein